MKINQFGYLLKLSSQTFCGKQLSYFFLQSHTNHESPQISKNPPLKSNDNSDNKKKNFPYRQEGSVSHVLFC